MNIRLLLFLCLGFFSCHLPEERNVALCSYEHWKILVSKKFQEELVIVCKNWPKEWDKCPDGVLDWTFIDSINVKNDIIIIEKLKKLHSLKERNTPKIAVIHEFENGFNSWYSETFVIKSGKEWKGLKLYKFAPPGNLKDLLAEKPVEKAVSISNKEMAYYVNIKSGTFAHNGGMKIITFLNQKNEIIGCHMALYP